MTNLKDDEYSHFIGILADIHRKGGDRGLRKHNEEMLDRAKKEGVDLALFRKQFEEDAKELASQGHAKAAQVMMEAARPTTLADLMGRK
jgi:hypothetical protein